MSAIIIFILFIFFSYISYKLGAVNGYQNGFKIANEGFNTYKKIVDTYLKELIKKLSKVYPDLEFYELSTDNIDEQIRNQFPKK